MNDLIVRQLEYKDCRELSEIEAENFSIPWSQKSLEEECTNDNSIYIIASYKESQEIAGHVGMHISFDEAEITNVVVRSKFRKKGIACLLLGQLIEMGRDRAVNRYYLEVRKSNQAAQNLYKKLGFKEVGIRKNFYEKPLEDALVMILQV